MLPCTARGAVPGRRRCRVTDGARIAARIIPYRRLALTVTGVAGGPTRRPCGAARASCQQQRQPAGLVSGLGSTSIAAGTSPPLDLHCHHHLAPKAWGRRSPIRERAVVIGVPDHGPPVPCCVVVPRRRNLVRFEMKWWSTSMSMCCPWVRRAWPPQCTTTMELWKWRVIATPSTREIEPIHAKIMCCGLRGPKARVSLSKMYTHSMYFHASNPDQGVFPSLRHLPNQTARALQ